MGRLSAHSEQRLILLMTAIGLFLHLVDASSEMIAAWWAGGSTLLVAGIIAHATPAYFDATQ